MLDWLTAFAFTQLVEAPIYARALERHGPARLHAITLLLAFAASALTHPIVWFVFPRLQPALSYRVMVLLAEVFAVAFEAVFLGLFGLRRAFRWSLLANGASLALGLLSRTLFGAP